MDIRKAITDHIAENNADFRKDCDALANGWDPVVFADESLVFQAVANKLEITAEDDEFITLWDEIADLFDDKEELE